MNKNIKLLSLLKYITYFLISINIIFTGSYKSQDMILLVGLMLIFIINTQLRTEYFKNNYRFIVVSLIIDIILITSMYLKFEGFIFIYYFISVLDASMLLPSIASYITLGLIYLSLLALSLKPMYSNVQNTALVNMFLNTIIVFIFGALGRSIEEEQNRKKEAQTLYDKLRVSEEELKGAYSRLEEYSNTIEELTLLRERNRISRELHDSIGHTLSTIIVQLQALPYIIPKDKDKSNEMINRLLDFSKKGMEDIRRTITELKPTAFDNYQGIFAIRELINNYEKLTAIKIDFITFNEDITLSSDESFIVYRIIQEALNNASKHSKASNIKLSVQLENNNIRLYIKDNGIGVKDIVKGFGISNMENRITKLGGSISFNTAINKGFEIIAYIPRI